ncbi:MAG TPA: glycosyltransferase [Candidatus Contendobacter sp.]|nr:glycosyltransferase [Candidatus Contendobacter sp.]HRZ24868.1 glycosyltransferase [Candidatus Contendobacter sp.]
MRVYLLSTAVAPLGSGLGGGVEHMVVTAARQLDALGYHTQVIAPDGSVADVPELLALPGRLAPTAVSCAYDAPLPFEADAFLVAALRWLAERVHPDDVILNFSYDWLPLFASDFLPCPLGSLISMSALNRSLDLEIRRIAAHHPSRLAFLSTAQAASFSLTGPVRLIPPGLDLQRYRYNAHPRQSFCWLGRVAPEKGLEDAFAFAAHTALSVTVFGAMQDRAYWAELEQRYPAAPVHYGGFLHLPALAEAVGEFCALLMTPKWVEAFGIAGIEALACGTPVIAYRCGGVSDYVRDGETGWLVEPDDLAGLIAAAERIGQIRRADCRALVEQRYTLAHYGAALADWLRALATESTEATTWPLNHS